jgi:hypothetical protein
LLERNSTMKADQSEQRAIGKRKSLGSASVRRCHQRARPFLCLCEPTRSIDRLHDALQRFVITSIDRALQRQSRVLSPLQLPQVRARNHVNAVENMREPSSFDESQWFFWI